MKPVHFTTIGTTFCEGASNAKTSDELFRVLHDNCAATEKEPKKLAEKIAAVDLPPSKAVANFKATVYKIQIKNRHKQINDSIAYVKDIRSYISKYLAHDKKFPKVTEYTTIAMAEYLNKGFGDVKDFKRDLYKHFDVDNQSNTLNNNLLGMKNRASAYNQAQML